MKLSPEERIKNMSSKQKDSFLLAIFRNPNFDPYFQWLDIQEQVTKSLSAMGEKMEKERGQADLDEFFKNMKVLSEAGEKSLKLQNTLDEMRKGFDPDELLREQERRLGAKEGSIEEYASRKEITAKGKIQERV